MRYIGMRTRKILIQVNLKNERTMKLALWVNSGLVLSLVLLCLVVEELIFNKSFFVCTRPWGETLAMGH